MAVLPKKPVDYSDLSIKGNVPRVISRSTGLSIKQVEFVFACLEALIKSELSLGRKVRIKGLGLFWQRRCRFQTYFGDPAIPVKKGIAVKVFFRSEAQLDKAIT